MLYGKMANAGISVMSFLAENYASEERFSGRTIATAREMPAMTTSKVLTILASHGLAVGTPGPGGGYRLTRTPDQIALHEIVRAFEPKRAPLVCPYGPEWCGHGPKCPLHDAISELEESACAFLDDTTLAVFVGHAPDPAHRSPIRSGQAAPKA